MRCDRNSVVVFDASASLVATLGQLALCAMFFMYQQAIVSINETMVLSFQEDYDLDAATVAMSSGYGFLMLSALLTVFARGALIATAGEEMTMFQTEQQARCIKVSMMLTLLPSVTLMVPALGALVSPDSALDVTAYEAYIPFALMAAYSMQPFASMVEGCHLGELDVVRPVQAGKHARSAYLSMSSFASVGTAVGVAGLFCGHHYDSGTGYEWCQPLWQNQTQETVANLGEYALLAAVVLGLIAFVPAVLDIMHGCSFMLAAARNRQNLQQAAGVTHGHRQIPQAVPNTNVQELSHATIGGTNYIRSRADALATLRLPHAVSREDTDLPQVRRTLDVQSRAHQVVVAEAAAARPQSPVALPQVELVRVLSI